MEIAGKKLVARHYVALLAILTMFIAPFFGIFGAFATVFIGYPSTIIAGILFLKASKTKAEKIYIIIGVIAAFCTANTLALLTLS